MQHRTLGDGLKVSALGLGCMGMTGVMGMPAMYGVTDEGEAIATVHRAIDLGVTFFDTAQVYGPLTNEELLGRAIAGRRDGLVIATKFGLMKRDGSRGLDSTAANIRAVCEASLTRLSIERIDLFYQHRVDPEVPIEDVIGTLTDLKSEGKIAHIGLSEAGEATLRKAAAVAPIAALQSEYSLWERDVEDGILPAARELGIGFVPYSPLGRGFLAGTAKRADEYPKDDYRSNDPRYQGDNYDTNMRAVAVVQSVAERHAVSAAQVALAWLLAQGDMIVPIPGAKRRMTLEDSMAAADVMLTADDLAELDAASPRGATAGLRYGNPAMMAMVRR